MSGFGLVCPCCGEPVRRRAGIERRPHFAHYSHRAKPDCENYFPLGSSAGLSGLRLVVAGTAARLARESLSCGILLAHEAAQNIYGLWLRIPSMDVDKDSTLEIQSGLGQRIYRGHDFRVPRVVPLAPQFPLVGCVGSGELIALAAHISSQVAEFDPRVNYFHAGQKGGRFVFRDEPLEWGGTYRVLAGAALSPPASLLAMFEWSDGPTFGGWHMYSFSLPTAFPASRPDIHSVAASFFGKRIRPSQPRAYIVFPSPHHIEIDGTYIFPESPEYFLVRRTVHGDVALKGAESAKTVELSEQWVRLEAPVLGAPECALVIDGSEQMLLRVETCSLFEPTGVRVSSNDFSWDLCIDAPIPPAKLQTTAVSVECSSERIALHLGRLNDNWSRTGRVLSLPSGAAKSLKAGSFGALRETAPAMVSTTVPQSLPTAQRRIIDVGVCAWIERLIADRFGQDGVARVRAFLADPSDSNLHRLGPVMLSPIMPYLRAAINAKSTQKAH
jgi:hypothetical protein